MPDWYHHYASMNYTQAAREGARLVEAARKSGGWADVPEKLAALRDVVQMTDRVPT